MTEDPILRFENLGVRFGPVDAVHDLSFTLRRGETAALVGESGSGKSVAMLAALGLLPPSATVAGHVFFNGQNLIGLEREKLDRIRGKAITIVFQEPQSALDPLFTVGSQIAAVLRFGLKLGRRAAAARAVELLHEVGILEPHRRAQNYPHELSGGQRQRVAIAMAIACDPQVLIADEPTTALDATVAAKILVLLADLKSRFGMALILISHDLGLVGRIADHVHVMQKGALVESGPVAQVTQQPRHPYTRMLLAAGLDRAARPATAPAPPLLEARDLGVSYTLRGAWFRPRRFAAVDGVCLTIPAGQTLGLIGESGSGKSTLGRALVKLEPARGQILYDGRNLIALSQDAMRPLRRDLQIVFQDPFSSLSPRLTVGAIVAEGLRIHEPALSATARRDRAAKTLDEVGLPGAFIGRLPHELSGGQRQRVAIARAIILQPRLVVLDEPTSALDRAVQAEVLALLQKLQDAHGLSYLFITHDLAVVRAVADRIAVMQDGRIVEEGLAAQVLDAPREAYTRELVASASFEPVNPNSVL
ncbi:ABC transporter ATP-binding protein [Beijerinckia sp. L45]|uniref:ABC transporter ATP-binding protein n=1 Tax=Beijerinckia sp. L45 TaxID=1641855 RepID=UPI00131E58E0|nr:dipeptide ABC transporter ATP-binding protein [Beijerinckia sp. L45]